MPGADPAGRRGRKSHAGGSPAALAIFGTSPGGRRAHGWEKGGYAPEESGFRALRRRPAPGSRNSR